MSAARLHGWAVPSRARVARSLTQRRAPGTHIPGKCWTLLDSTGLCWTLLDSAGMRWNGSRWTSLDSAGLRWTLLGCAGMSLGWHFRWDAARMVASTPLHVLLHGMFAHRYAKVDIEKEKCPTCEDQVSVHIVEANHVWFE